MMEEMEQMNGSGSGSRLSSVSSHTSLSSTEKPEGSSNGSSITTARANASGNINRIGTVCTMKSNHGSASSSRTSIDSHDEKKDSINDTNGGVHTSSSKEREPSRSDGSKQTVASTITDGGMDEGTQIKTQTNSGVGSASDFDNVNQRVEQEHQNGDVDAPANAPSPISVPATVTSFSSVQSHSAEPTYPASPQNTLRQSQDWDNTMMESSVSSPSRNQNHERLSPLTDTNSQSWHAHANNTNINESSNKSENSIQQQPDSTMGTDANNNNVDNIDSILQSPQTKDEIVEKSPGGRYLRFSEKLGSGAYKDVYRAYDTSEGIEVAWNVVNLTGVPKTERQYIVNEVRLLEKLNHSNIISFHGSWVNRGLDQVIFVTEILSSGTLKSFINKVQVIRYKIAKRWAIQILKGLEYLHSNDPPIIHRDLKCDNIFINGTSGDLRIGDLGLSTVISNKSQLLSVLGTPEFMAPELYNESYNEKVDIYAFGMCMLEIFTKEAPYRECTNPAQIYKKVSTGIEPESLKRICSSNARDFIRQCLGTTDENGHIVRPSASYLLAHPFLEKRQNDDSEVLVDPPLRERPISEHDGSGEIQPTVYAEPPVHTNSDSGRTAGGDQMAQNSPVEYPVNAGQSAVIAGNQSPPVLNVSKAPIRQPSVEGNDNRATLDALNKQNIPPQQFSAMAQPTEKSSFDFESMPETEINMKPVKVLMGRGQELDDSNHHEHIVIPTETQPPLPAPAAASSMPIPIPLPKYQQAVPVVNDDDGTSKKRLDPAEMRQSLVSTESQNSLPAAKSKYSLTAAVVDNNEPAGVYSNDIMQLRMTLTVGHEEHHIQFGFHLVQDDAIQVAKEMVTELNLPTDAILETSEIISSMARKARIQQDNYKNIIQQQNYDTHLERSMESISSLPIEPQMVVPSMNSAPFVAQNSASVHPPNAANYDNHLDRSMEGSTSSQMGLPTTNDALPLSSLLSNGLPNVNIPLHQVPVRAASSSAVANLNSPERKSLPPHANVPLHQHPSNAESSTISVTNLVATAPNSLPQQPVRTTGNYHAASTKSLSGVTSTTQTSNQELNRSPSGNLLGSTIELKNENEDEDDMSNSAELLQLKQEHEKRIQRARKAFGTRMDNLQRSREEKEALHLQTLKKHEKETAALEKRLKMAEVEQQQRLQKLEKEFFQQREIAKQQSKKVNPPIPLSDEDDMAISLESNISNMNLSSMVEKTSAGSSNPDQVAKAPSPATLSQDGSEII